LRSQFSTAFPGPTAPGTNGSTLGGHGECVPALVLASVSTSVLRLARLWLVYRDGAITAGANINRMLAIFFITHPDVRIDPNVPVPEWPLNERGRARMRAMAAHPWVGGVRSIFASGERKARDAAQLLAEGLGLQGYSVVDCLGENDRSATGYLLKQEFEATANAFFALPQTSVRGWEPAADAQARISRAGRVAGLRQWRRCRCRSLGARGRCSIAILPDCRSAGVTSSPRQMVETGLPSIERAENFCRPSGAQSTHQYR
jgi:hypothetical protein